jgi:arginase family enzyme
MATPAIALTAFLARCADRNADGMAGAKRLADALSARFGLPVARIGNPQPPQPGNWGAVLDDARPSLTQLAQRQQAVFERGDRPLLVMARCASGVASLPAMVRSHPGAKLVWFDAHADSNTPATSTTGYLGGMVISAAAGLWDSGFGGGLDLSNVVLVGARDIDPAERALVESSGMRHVPAGPGLASRLREAIGSAPAYIHLDCDVLEPGIVPTEYEVAGGLTLADLEEVCSVLAGNEVVGVEIAEFQSLWPSGEQASTDGLVAAIRPLLERMGAELH